MNKKEKVNEIIEQINKLFITFRGKYLCQVGSGGNSRFITTQTAKLTDSKVENHIKGVQTIGLLLGEGGLTKFLTFDVDIMDEYDRKRTTLALVDKLNTYYGIPIEDIHVWYSGLKGYHVDLYFDEPIWECQLVPFYEEVLSKLDEVPKRIERRPTTGMGVKLPLGIHKVTGKRCPYVDNQTLKPLSMKHFLSIEPQSLNEFKENVLVDCLKPAKKKKIELLNKEDKSGGYESKLDGIEVRKNVKNILKVGHLLFPHTRNDFTYYASMVFKSEGNSIDETVCLISQVLNNTLEKPSTRHYLDSSWTIQSLESETRRIVENTYKYDYSISSKAKEVTFYKEEIDIISTIKKRNLRRLMFSLLHHSKKYAREDGIFYCTHKTLAEMGNDSHAGRSMENIRKLEKMGFLEIIRFKKFTPDGKCAPNIYKMLIDSTDRKETSRVTYDSSDQLELEDVTKKLYSDRELKEFENKSDKIIYTFKIDNKEHPSN